MTDLSFDEVGQGAVDAVLNASRALVAVAARSLNGTEDEVTLTQFRALSIVASNSSCSLNALALSLGVTAPTASRMCDRLESKKLLERSSDQKDRRQIQVILTDRGQALFDAVVEKRRLEISQILESVPSDEQRVIADALGRFASAAQDRLKLVLSANWDL